MEKLELKKDKLFSALDRLGEAVSDLKKINQLTEQQFEELSQQFDFFDKENIYRARRDSLIQRFEFCSDLFWKYLKLYMTERLNRNIEVSAPKPVIRDAHNAKIITEADTRDLLEMISDRNLSSHIYKEEVADQIGVKVARYYEIMKKYAEKFA